MLLIYLTYPDDFPSNIPSFRRVDSTQWGRSHKSNTTPELSPAFAKGAICLPYSVVLA